MIQFDEHLFGIGVETTQVENHLKERDSNRFGISNQITNQFPRLRNKRGESHHK